MYNAARRRARIARLKKKEKRERKRKKYHQLASDCIFIRGDIFTVAPVHAHDARGCVSKMHSPVSSAPHRAALRCESRLAARVEKRRKKKKKVPRASEATDAALVQLGSGTIHFSNSHNAFLWAPDARRASYLPTWCTYLPIYLPTNGDHCPAANFPGDSQS